jgi:predicted nuclease with RNAse H fold
MLANYPDCALVLMLRRRSTLHPIRDVNKELCMGTAPRYGVLPPTMSCMRAISRQGRDTADKLASRMCEMYVSWLLLGGNYIEASFSIRMQSRLNAPNWALRKVESLPSRS